MKDVIKSDGEWVSSLQIEELIVQFPDVKGAAVTGISDEKWGERPFAVVVKDSDHAARMHEADIKAHLQAFAGRGVISKFGIPEKIEFVDALAKRRASARSTRSFCVKRMRTSRNGRRPDDRQNERRVWGRARRLRNYTSGIEFSLVMPRETVAIALATICRDLPGFSGARWRMPQIETQHSKTKKDGVSHGHRRHGTQAFGTEANCSPPTRSVHERPDSPEDDHG